jgi:hypothetical protein
VYCRIRHRVLVLCRVFAGTGFDHLSLTFPVFDRIFQPPQLINLDGDRALSFADQQTLVSAREATSAFSVVPKEIMSPGSSVKYRLASAIHSSVRNL